MSGLAVEVLRVFCDARARGGNALGVVLEPAEIARDRRQLIACELGYSETIFLERDGRCQIFTPQLELPFAGHPLVGAAWRLGISTLHPPAGPIRAGADREGAWIAATPDMAPAWELRQLASPEEVDRLEPSLHGHVQCWAWLDERAGLVRARVFAPDYGIAEDPATGSAAILLCASLGRPIVIEQGRGSVIRARPLPGGEVQLGGRVVAEASRTLHAHQR